jgi:mannose-6-phosphate isomerase-like protein (cupin superfamily)
MFGKTLKELNNKSFVKKINYTNCIYEKISSEKEFSYFRVNLNRNINYKINHKSFYLFLNKGCILINKKKFLNNYSDLLLSKNFLYFKTLKNTELYIFFFKKISKLKINITKKILISKILPISIKHKKKYWGNIYDLLQHRDGAIKIIEMDSKTQSSMEFHIQKKENYFLEYGEMDLGIRYSRGLNGIIKLKKNNSFLMNPGTMHMRMAKKNCKIIEMSTRDHDNDSIIVHDGKKYKFKIN